MLNRNGLKCIELPQSYLKNTDGEKTANIHAFNISNTYYTSNKNQSSNNYYLGLFNDNKDLTVDTYFLDGEILLSSGTAGSYLTDTSMDATNIVTLTRTITNKTDKDYVINTVGLVYCSNPNIPEYCLMSCERIPTVTIKPQETYTFTHKIKIA